MKASPRQQRYWRRNIRVTMLLLMVWLGVILGIAWFSRSLAGVEVLGLPFGFFMGAQGGLLVSLAVIWGHARYMNRLDREHGVRDR